MSETQDEFVIVTRELMNTASTSTRGAGFVNKQLDILMEVGINGKIRGWAKGMLGMRLPKPIWDRFVAAGNTKRERNHNRLLASQTTPATPTSPIKVHETTTFVSKDKRNQLFADPMYRIVRAAVLRKAPWCVLCGRKPPAVVLNVDHIVPLTVDWNRRMDPTNLQVLCEDCNVGKSNYWT